MYADRNYRTKKEFLAAVAAHAAGTGPAVTVYQPGVGGFFPSKRDGVTTVVGPHYPEPHRWYASVTIAAGVVVKAR